MGKRPPAKPGAIGPRGILAGRPVGVHQPVAEELPATDVLGGGLQVGPHLAWGPAPLPFSSRPQPALGAEWSKGGPLLGVGGQDVPAGYRVEAFPNPFLQAALGK